MMKITLMWQQDGQQIVEVMVLSRLITIGRSPVSDVVVKQPTISRQHAFLFAFGRKVYVQNVSQTNRIRMGGKTLRTNETAEVQAGQVLVLGDVPLQAVELSDALFVEEQVVCAGCAQTISAALSDCHWCGTSLAFAAPAAAGA